MADRRGRPPRWNSRCAGCDVHLLEKEPTPVWKIGETLPPEARPYLQRLGHWPSFQEEGHLPCYGVVSVWGHPHPLEKDFVFNPWGHGWQLDRMRFEAGLLQAAVREGCDRISGVRVDGIESCATGWIVQTATHTIRADWLVDCTGRAGVFVSRMGGQYEDLDRLVAAYTVISTSQSTDVDARTWVESQVDGWCYTALMPSGRRTLAFLTDADMLPQSLTAEWFEKRLRGCPHIHELVYRHRFELVEAPRLARAHSGRFQRFAGPNWLAVGDAAMTFDPISGQGSAKALVSAQQAVQAILFVRDYQADCEQLWKNYLHERRAIYREEMRWGNHRFWSRRHT